MAQGAGAGPVGWFVRHTESVWNRDGLVQGQARAPGLTPAGLAQASRLADDLADCGAGIVVTSDLRRAVETATPIAARLGVPVRTDRRLRERNLGALEGGPSSALVPEVLGYRGGEVTDLDARAPGGESLRELRARVSEWLEEVRAAPPAGVFVAVTHGGLLRVARTLLASPGDRAFSGGPIPNGARWRVELATGQIDEEFEPPLV